MTGRPACPPITPQEDKGSGMSSPAEGSPLKIPPQDLDILSFAQPNPKRVREWVEGLPQMNVGETAKRIYAAVQEISRLRIDSESRFQMLEAMRGPIHFVCNALSKHFLNKPVVLPTKEAKIANLAQALQNHLAAGYKVVASQVLARSKLGDKDARRMCARSLHRAITEMNLVLLRSYQLYFPAPPGYWRELHQIFLVAEAQDLLTMAIDDPEEAGISTTIYDAYRRSLLFSTAKPNQLRQAQIEQVYKASANWFRFCEVAPASGNKGLYTLNLSADSHPVYPALQKRPDDLHHARFFDASRISEMLRTHLQLPAGQAHPERDFSVPADIQADLVRILIQAWGVLTERAFTRIEEHGQIKLCIGLSATHYFVSDKQDFNKLVRGTSDAMLHLDESNRFLAAGPTHRRDVIERHDVWGLQVDRKVSIGGKELSIEEKVRAHQNQPPPVDSDKYPSYVCDIVNTSPGGFCISWKQDVPPQVKTGEIIGVKEHEGQPWSIGVIRWVKQFRNEGARMGLELLAPKAEPCGTQAIQKKGGITEYMRTLILPELKAVGQPATLITPNISFSVGCKININQEGVINKAQLVKQVASTASFCQFQYKMLTATAADTTPGSKPPPGTPPSAPASDDDFDSIWSSL